MIKIKMFVKPGVELPSYESENAAGMDLRAFLSYYIRLEPGDRILVPTGLFIEIPKGYEGQIRPRSGLAYKEGVTVLNSPGTIDSDYRGEIKVLLINHNNAPVNINHGDRIAQLIIAPVEQACIEVVEHIEDLEDTKRGTGGFGSTGK